MLKAYDPEILGRFAQRLIRRADSTVALYAFFGLMLGAFAFYAVGSVGTPALGMAVAVLVLLMALLVGYERAFTLRVQAQTVLCQVAIEMNTRQMVISSQMHAARPSM
ncbi:MAG: hypothetical protein IPK74_24965 [Deltaproteobacteria bacterium]|nr:hypothetical protein [Deltaproteobacteria bacterium]